jgi:hypothetical protein
MTVRLVDRLSAARRRQFVGRSGELAIFQAALTSAEPSFHILHVFGPGGVGKTTLLAQFLRACDEAYVRVFHLDARNIEPTPAAFLTALGAVMGLSGESPVSALCANEERQVILVDTYEVLAPLDLWLREELLPELPESVIVVLAGRNPPAAAWRIDPGWRSLIRTISLQNLNQEEGREYLTRRGVPAEQQRRILEFTHCHPLALSLVADAFAQRGDLEFEPHAVPDVVKTLLEHFVQKVPGPAHRAALESCALVRVMTEALLGQMLAMPDVHDLFNWLRGLSFIESGNEGIFPHDLAREALVADLRWRNPDWYVDLHSRARSYYASRLQHAHSRDQQRLLVDYVYLHRDNPAIRSIFQWQGIGGAFADAADPADWPGIEAIVREHEGEESAAIARFWFDRQIEGFLVFREAGDQIAGFMAMISIHDATGEEMERDPAIGAAARFLRRSAPLRAGERATHFRFWMARESYHAVSPVQSLIFVNVARHYLTTPALAYTFFPCADPEFWAAGFAYIDLHRIPDADYAVGGKSWGVYGHDWRIVPPTAWLALLADREVGGSAAPASAPAAAQLEVLSREEFAEALQEAMRSYTSPEALRETPLLRSRLVHHRTGADADVRGRIEALRAAIRETIELLGTTPKEEKLHRVLHRTYLNPAATQERAAELLDLPFSTYRRHLKSGIETVVQILWQQELNGPGSEQ